MKTIQRTITVDLSATGVSVAQAVDNIEGYSICASWDGGVGTLELEASNNAFLDNVNNNENPSATWVTITGSSVAISGAGTQFWNVSDVYYRAFRIKYTSTSGTGTLTAYVFCKGIT